MEAVQRHRDHINKRRRRERRALAVEAVQRHRDHINKRRRRERRALAVQKDRTAGNWSAEHMGEEEEAEHVKEGEEDTLADRTAGDYFQTH